METYGKILLVAMPAFLVLVLFEKAYGVWKGKDTVRNLDMVSVSYTHLDVYKRQSHR